MVHAITVPGVNEAFEEGYWHLKTCGITSRSRNGEVVRSPGMVITTYTDPRQRVLFSEDRDCNHVFHLMEAIWMFSGGQDVQWLLQFNNGFGRYAEADGTMHGAYGYRWRNHFLMDQIYGVLKTLSKDPYSRQAVIAMWDPTSDLEGDWKDRPCNTHVYFDYCENKLNMTVCCRSNDMLWGAYGSNIVHFSMLHELIASGLDLHLGEYRQMSNNFHIYKGVGVNDRFLDYPPTSANYNRYENYGVQSIPLLSDDGEENITDFLQDCERLVLMHSTVQPYRTAFFRNVAVPIYSMWQSRKAGRPYSLSSVADCDWKIAVRNFLQIRGENV